MAEPVKIEGIKKKIIIGTKVTLVPFTNNHLHNPHYLAWLKDYETIKHLNLPRYLEKVSFEEVKAYVNDINSSVNNLFFAIETLSNNQFIGTFKIGPIDWYAQNANLGILIGDRSYWGKGIASDIFSAAIRFCFEELKMHKIVGGCMGPNVGMKRVFEKLGFKQEGCFHEHDFLEGKYYNHLYYGLLRTEYEQQETIKREKS